MHNEMSGFFGGESTWEPMPPPTLVVPGGELLVEKISAHYTTSERTIDCSMITLTGHLTPRDDPDESHYHTVTWNFPLREPIDPIAHMPPDKVQELAIQGMPRHPTMPLTTGPDTAPDPEATPPETTVSYMPQYRERDDTGWHDAVPTPGGDYTEAADLALRLLTGSVTPDGKHAHVTGVRVVLASQTRIVVMKEGE